MSTVIRSDSGWSGLITPLLRDAWWEMRRQILLASRANSDTDSVLIADPHHMGDPAQKVDQHMQQFSDSALRRAVPGILVFGEEAPMSQVLLSPAFNHIAYLDPVDGSAPAWAIPGGWGHVIVIQQFVGLREGRPYCPLRYVGVLDAEGGTVVYDKTEPYVAIDLIDQGFEGGEAYDAEPLTYDGNADTFHEITAKPVLIVGGYKPHWWTRFCVLRERALEHWPEAQVFNIAGAPVTRKVIQNADNIAVQLNPSSLWDGVCAILVSAAGGTVVPIGSTEPAAQDEVLGWWSQLGYERDPDRGDGSMRAARRVPGFVAGMRADRVIEAAGMCHDLPGGR